MDNFMIPIRKKAESWLEREIYLSPEYQTLANRLQENELHYAHQVLTRAATELGLMEILRLDPTIKEELKTTLEPFGTSRLFFARSRKIVQTWDINTKPTEFLLSMKIQNKKMFEKQLSGDLQMLQQVEWLKKPFEIEDQALPLIVNKYNRYEGISKVIMTDDN